MEDCFCNLASAVRLLLITGSKDYATLKSCLKEFEKQCKKLDDFELAAFKDLHYEEVTKIVFFLREVKDDGEIRSYHDRIFKNMLHLLGHVPRKVTKIFDEFIKGITYFEYDNPTQEPVYHRLASCGPGTNAFRKLHQQCTKDMDKARKNEIKQKIEKCYVERLIYNTIYKEHELAFGTHEVTQDDGHMHRMSETLADFKTCFPNIKINVRVEFDAHLPVKLILEKSVNGRVIMREEYSKEIEFEETFGGKKYNDFVHCVKFTNKAEFARVQTYGGQLKRWTRVKNGL